MEIMTETGRWQDDRYHGGDRIYTFGNKSTIQFTSFDSVGKAKAAGKRDVLYMNECNHITFDIADALYQRTDWFTIFDYNPDREFWINTEIMSRPDAETLTLTYLDNEACPQKIINDLMIKLDKAFYDPKGNRNDPKNIKNDFWANWCKVYVFGEEGSLEGQVYDFEIIDEIPKEARYYKTGLDFGMSPDPSAACDIYMNGKNVYLDEVIYDINLSTAQLESLLKQSMRRHIIADSSEKRTVNELQTKGLLIKSIQRKPTIQERIRKSKDYKLHITSRSLNFIKEGRMHIYKKDEFGKPTTPIESFNHLWDAFAYGFSEFILSGKGLRAL
jgi:phage terminase large subunit